MDAEYEPPCRVTLKQKVTCKECGKRLTLHTLRYRHLCVPATERLRAAQEQARRAVAARAEAAVEAEKRARFARLVSL